MDGNRRWAKEKGLPTSIGHKKGAEVIEDVVKFCLEQKIRYLTLYTFSIENLQRSDDEKNNIFALIPTYFEKYKKELINNRIKIKIIGDKSLIPKNIHPYFQAIENDTKNGDLLTVSFLFCYGGRQELCAAVKKISSLVLSNKINVDQISEDRVKNTLWSCELPYPDLLIRTGKRNRISNFLIWQIAYSEIMFLDIYWPDINKKYLINCCKKFQNTHRTFGQ